MKEKYIILKECYLNYLVLVKSGSFYVTHNEDALIMNKIFNYQIINGKIGFPLNNIDKIQNKLNNLELNYLIYQDDDNIIRKEFNNNIYNLVLNDSKKQEFRNNMKKLLIDRVEYLIDSNFDNYDKLRKFIDEL